MQSLISTMSATNVTEKRRLHVEDYSVGWVCALSIELAAATEMLDEEHDSDIQPRQSQNDSNIYTLGRIGKHNVVIACLPERQMGTTSAATVATQMMARFPAIQLGLMVGIGGGVPSVGHDIRLGDVVISVPENRHGGVVQYDFGKAVVDGEFLPTGFLNAPPQRLLNAVSKFKSNRSRGGCNIALQLPKFNHLPGFAFDLDLKGPDILFKADFNHLGDSTTCDACRETGKVVKRRPRRIDEDIQIHYGTIASGNQVIKDAVTRDRLSSSFGGILCFEMEAAGLMNHFPSLVIRGISDYADSHKNKGWQPYAAATAAVCAKEILSLVPTTTRAPVVVTPESASNSKGFWLVPFGKNPDFIGRSSELEKIEKSFFPEDEHQRRGKVAIAGLGGIGKTQIAIEFANRMRTRFNCSVFWVPAISVEMFQEAYREMGRMLNIQHDQDGTSDIGMLVKERLSQESFGRWLLIVDNADDVDLWFESRSGEAISGSEFNLPLIEYLPTNPQGSILFTTRDRKAAFRLTQNTVIDIDEMNKEDASQLLKRSLHETVGSTDGADKLLDRLANFPLAIAQASSFMNENSISPEDYLSLFNNKEANSIELLSKDFGAEGRYKESKNPVATTWLLSFDQIRRQNKLAVDYLSFISCIAPNKIPLSLLPAASEMEVAAAIGTLTSYSFITKLPNPSPPANADERLFNIHPLVHLAIRNWLQLEYGHDILESWSRAAINKLEMIIPDLGNNINYDSENIATWRLYQPHAVYVLKTTPVDECSKKTGLRYLVGVCLRKEGNYKEAEYNLLRACSWLKSVLGESHPDTLRGMGSLAITYWSQGRWKEAEGLQVKLLEKGKMVLGESHPNTLDTMCNLANTYWSQGRWKEAEELEVELLEKRKMVLGESHPNTLDTMGNLATTYQKQGRWKEAEELQVEVLEKKKMVLGESHPTTLDIMDNLAINYLNQGRLKEAVELQVEVLEKSKMVLGESHPSTLYTMNNLAITYSNQGRWEEAEKLQVGVLEKSKMVLGVSHPRTLNSMSSLATTYSNQGRWEEAEELQVVALEKSKMVLGESHPSTLRAMDRLAATYWSQVRRKEAIKLLFSCYQLTLESLGPDHPDTKERKRTLKSWRFQRFVGKFGGKS